MKHLKKYVSPGCSVCELHTDGLLAISGPAIPPIYEEESDGSAVMGNRKEAPWERGIFNENFE